jgi:hypothetical protein
VIEAEWWFKPGSRLDVNHQCSKPVFHPVTYQLAYDSQSQPEQGNALNQ